jgi:hypothetical protein
MNKLIIFTVGLMALGTVSLSAQNPVPDPDTLQNPVQEGDPAVRSLPPRLDYVEDRKRITVGELPAPVRQSLESSAQYTDWEKAALFHDSNKDEYLVEFTQAGKTTTYRFNKEGKPIVEEN